MDISVVFVEKSMSSRIGAALEPGRQRHLGLG